MKIVVDSNIVFSAILNTKSNIGQLLINGSIYFDYYTVDLLKEEIFDHQRKILELTKFSPAQFNEIYQLVSAKIKFIDDVIIPDYLFDKAMKIVSDIDEDDVLFVALTYYLKAKLWTGDKKLAK